MPIRLEPRLIALALAAAVGVAHAGVAREDILYLAADGDHYTAFKTLRSDLPKRELLLADNATPENYLYIYPDRYERQAVAGGTRLTFRDGSYAVLRNARFKDWQITARKDGSHVFHSWDGHQRRDKHLGKWNAPGPFSHFAYVWVVPANIEILDYRCNREGKWTHKGKTLVWSGENVNDLTFTVHFKLTGTPSAAAPVSAPPEPATPKGAGERITLHSAVLFAPGSATIKPEGKNLLAEVAKRLDARNPQRVIVAGFTDDRALKPYLRKKYPSNWELSAARATVVVRWLAAHGVDPGVLEAAAFGQQRPVASNATAAGRARNRRIEIRVVGAGQSK